LNRVAVLHAFGLINSMCHLLGTRPFKTHGADTSVNNAFVAFKEAVESMPVKRVFASEEKTIRTASAKMPVVGQREVATSESFEDFSALTGLGWSK